MTVAAIIAATALLGGSALIALALVKRTAQRRAAANPSIEPAVPRSGNGADRSTNGGAAPPDDRDALLLRLSHDLRAPLGSVVTLCQLLLDGDAGPLSMKQHQYVEVIRRGGQTVLALVDDMLDLVAIDSGRSDVEPELADVAALARQAADASHPLAREKGIPIQVSAPGRPVAARVDARRLRHVLSRMVEHVVSATDHGYVEVDVEPADGTVEVAIRNTRDGLSEAARRMLEAHVDLEAPATSAAELQAPLPLTVAARLARKLGTPIELRSADDEGLSLALSVPLAADGAAVALAPADDSPARTGGRVLLIDDDAAERAQVTSRLEASGYAVLAVSSGEEGLRLMRQHPFDAVVLDLVMPGLSGLEVLRAARADGRLTHLPFVVLSAMYMTRAERAVLGPGVAGVVRKGDVSGDELLRAVERALSAAAAEGYPTGDRHV
ncbi:MAG TPA: hybrid sensor histidine kinase/response regulator [Polyangia bacterium]|nr:hybrid sensor histidine kinase/response regulator [Polyangia bacterium]